MRYLKDGDLLDRKGKPMPVAIMDEATKQQAVKDVVKDDGTKETVKVFRDKPMQIGEFMVSLVNNYQPGIGKDEDRPGLTLHNPELRLRDKVLDKLEDKDYTVGPDGDYFAFEETQFTVLTRVVNTIAPLLLGRMYSYAPVLEDLLKDAVDESNWKRMKTEADKKVVASTVTEDK